MCGLWFYASHDPIISYKDWYGYNKNVIRRGPDKTNTIMSENFLLAFHRLSFNDLSPLGDQPFCFHEGDKIVYLMVNGEIYNYKNLIQKYNLEMRSGNDCEVIYHLWKKFDEDLKSCVLELDGEFAFVMIEIVKNKIKIRVARDGFGIRPLFFSKNQNGIAICSILKDLPGPGKVFPPGVISEFTLDHLKNMRFIPYFNHIEGIEFFHYKIEDYTLYKLITDKFIEAIRKRMDGERSIGCLLSGGLDSSLVAAVIIKILGYKNMPTFSIGIDGSTDLEYAKRVSDHLNSVHHEILFTEQEGIDVIDQVIEATETWDITTIRASIGQFLLAKYISTFTDCKTILNGDGSDELLMGYLYWYLAPNQRIAHDETIRRLEEIHLYDALRVDRCLGWHGLESRFPFLDKDFSSLILHIHPKLRMPGKDRMEKFILRRAFEAIYPDILPDCVLWRKKEAFSDGISSTQKSWFKVLQNYFETRVSDEEMINFNNRVRTKEAFYYLSRFRRLFGDENLGVIPNYWLPRWIETDEPSARSLEIYEN